MITPTCHCGTATQSPHEIGTQGCQRYLTVAPKPAPDHPTLGVLMWDTGPEGIITDYTLRHQRGYHQHEDGQWSRWSGSTNSL